MKPYVPYFCPHFANVSHWKLEGKSRRFPIKGIGRGPGGLLALLIRSQSSHASVSKRIAREAHQKASSISKTGLKWGMEKLLHSPIYKLDPARRSLLECRRRMPIIQFIRCKQLMFTDHDSEQFHPETVSIARSEIILNGGLSSRCAFGDSKICVFALPLLEIIWS